LLLLQGCLARPPLAGLALLTVSCTLARMHGLMCLRAHLQGSPCSYPHARYQACMCLLLLTPWCYCAPSGVGVESSPCSPLRGDELRGSRRMDVRRLTQTVRIGQGNPPGGAAETHVSPTSLSGKPYLLTPLDHTGADRDNSL
jgi:hypothetical protein